MKLVNQISSIAKQLRAVAGTVTAVVVIAGVGAATTRATNKRAEEQQLRDERMFDSIASVKTMVEYNSIEIGFQGEQLYKIQDTLDDIFMQNRKQNNDISSLVWAIENKEGLTPEQLKNALDEMLKKNLGLSLRPIVLPGVSSIRLGAEPIKDQ